MPQFRVVLKKSAEKEFSVLDAKLQERILDVLSQLEEDPRPIGARKLNGPYDLWRVRVGNYRILYKIEDNILKVYVVRIEHRRQVYRRLEALM